MFSFPVRWKHEADLFTWAKVLSLIGLVITLVSINGRGSLFYGSYRVDLFSQIFKAVFAYGFVFVIFMLGRKNEIEEGYLAEYFMFLGFRPSVL